MLSTLIKWLVALTYPPMLSACLLVCAMVAWRLRRRGLGTALLVLAVAWSTLWSIPNASEWLRAPLERQHAVVAMSALPRADAIVVLGGGKVRPDQLMSSRLAAAAHAWGAGRARIIILSGGGGRSGTGRGRSEPFAKQDGALGSRGCEVHCPPLISGASVEIHTEPGLFVEGLRTVDVGHRQNGEFEFEVHYPSHSLGPGLRNSRIPRP